MIVYGDRARTAQPAAEAASIAARLDALSRPAPSPPAHRCARHDELRSLLLASGELAQGLADAAFAESGVDRFDRPTTAALRLTCALGALLWRSHRSRYSDAGPITRAADAAARLVGLRLPPAVRAKSPEGYLHYAVYPESYAEAARAVSFDPAPFVIGVRTIGTTLAAMVAAACPAAPLPLTVRPVGHPFARELALAPSIHRQLRRAHTRTIAVADEGPGLSGSSFVAVLDALERAGVPASQVHLFPSHLGLGGEPAGANRARLAAHPRHTVPFEQLFFVPGPTGLSGWVEELIGPARELPEDLGGGRWRARLYPDTDRWPAAQVTQERRKYLLRTARGAFLAKFAGLGRYGEERYRRARTCAEAGFAPAVLGLRSGFLVSPWLSDARPLAGAAVARGAFRRRLADYVCSRARDLPSGVGHGAAPAELYAMALANATEALGAEDARPLERFEPWLADLTRSAIPIEIDGRLHLHEWLLLPDGRLLKTDVADHCDGHDLIGCQDLAWDVAGGAVELALTPPETEQLRREVGARGAPIEPEPLAFYRACYLAFQLGAHRMAARAAEAFDPPEAARLDRAALGYADRLRTALRTSPAR